MQKNVIYQNNIITPLGVINFEITSDKNVVQLEERTEYKNGKSQKIKTLSYKIEIIEFKVEVSLYNGNKIIDSNCVIFKIEKQLEISENITLHGVLKNNEDVEFSIDTGENLEAICAENEKYILHIGTEDDDTLNNRKLKENWFPKRLTSSITEYRNNGFITKIPDLNKGEKIYIHYLTAYNTKFEDNVSTWLAVDNSKENLEKWIGINENN